MRFSRPFILAVLFLCAFAPARAEFGNYQSHAQAGQTLRVTTDIGELAITVIDQAAFEVHYVEPGRKQLPSFALAGPPPQLGPSWRSKYRAIPFLKPSSPRSVATSPARRP